MFEGIKASDPKRNMNLTPSAGACAGDYVVMTSCQDVHIGPTNITQNNHPVLTRIQPIRPEKWRCELKSMFVETRAYHEAACVLKEYNIVLVLGFVGDGKTTIAKMLALQYDDEGYSVFHVTDPKDWREAINQTGKVVIVCDDAFGTFYPDSMLGDSWLRERSLIQDCKQDKNIKLILTSRNYVYEQSKPKQCSVLPEYVIVDINSESLRLTYMEMKMMLENCICENKCQVKLDVVEHVAKNSGHLFFPQCCLDWTMTRKRTENDFVECRDYLISAEINAIMELSESAAIAFLFKIMALNDGCISRSERNWSLLNGIIHDIEKGATSSYKHADIKRAIGYLQGTIIAQKENNYQFAYDCMWSQVVKKIDPKLIFQHASVKFVAEHVRGEEESVDRRKYMVMAKEYYPDFLVKLGHTYKRRTYIMLNKYMQKYSESTTVSDHAIPVMLACIRTKATQGYFPIPMQRLFIFCHQEITRKRTRGAITDDEEEFVNKFIERLTEEEYKWFIERLNGKDYVKQFIKRVTDTEYYKRLTEQLIEEEYDKCLSKRIIEKEYVERLIERVTDTEYDKWLAEHIEEEHVKWLFERLSEKEYFERLIEEDHDKRLIERLIEVYDKMFMMHDKWLTKLLTEKEYGK